MNLKYNKKGSILDVIGVMIALLVLMISMFMGYLIYKEMITVDILNEHVETQNIMNEAGWVFTTMGDNLIMLLFVGMSIGAIVSATLSRAHPIFMFLAIIIAIFMIVIAVVVANWYGEFSENELVQPIIVDYPHTDFIFRHMPMLTMCIITIVGISLYMARGRNTQIQL